MTYELDFTEKMRGWFTFGETDCRRGADQGRVNHNDVMFRLTIATDDVNRFIADRDHVGSAAGYVESDSLGGRRPVEKGVFNLFVDDAAPPGGAPGAPRKRMLYRLFFSDAVGRPLTLSGFKDIRPNPLADLWPETSTLYTQILDGHVGEGDVRDPEVVGSGVLRIKPLDFAWQLTTFRVHGGEVRGRFAALGAFGKLFGGELWDVFNPLGRIQGLPRI